MMWKSVHRKLLTEAFFDESIRCVVVEVVNSRLIPGNILPRHQYNGGVSGLHHPDPRSLLLRQPHLLPRLPPHRLHPRNLKYFALYASLHSCFSCGWTCLVGSDAPPPMPQLRSILALTVERQAMPASQTGPNHIPGY
mmetsp:Transcript_72053/g.192557  ORF Transcript_72053/g.192557 Transcript_72053/m.192557 type:complete len:138 (-) Transcript_72053:198-611(-)